MDKRIFWLALGSFAIGTEGYMIGGLLPTLAAALHVSTALAGQLVTAFSLVYAMSSPILTTLTGRMERRKLLFGALLLLAAGNVVCGLASSYGLMMAGRIVAALGAGLFSPGAVACRLHAVRA
ncbi:MFS transporter [Paenibacillus sp. JTLBN-2024]